MPEKPTERQRGTRPNAKEARAPASAKAQKTQHNCKFPKKPIKGKIGNQMHLKKIQSQLLSEMLSDTELTANAIVHSTRSLSAEKRLSLYKNSILQQLLSVLTSTFKTCYALVGDTFFNAMAFRYINKYPSLQPDLEFYGDHFADFVATFPPANALPYLADCCRLDYACQKIYWAKESIDLDNLAFYHDNQLQQWIQQQKIIDVASDFPILSIRRYCQDAKAQQKSFNLDQHNSESCLVYRHDYAVRVCLAKQE